MPTNPTANPAIALYNFYRRYLWTDVDFTTWQTGMVQYAQGIMDGTFHGAVLQGLGYLGATGLNIQVDGGIAVGPTGQLLVLAATGAYGATGQFATPASHPARSLVVIRPNIVQSTFITRPTNPFDSVPLQQLQEANVVFIDGTPAASPAYPATQPGDVILFGVRLASGATGFATTDLDFEIRDVMGKNSLFQKNQTKYDDRVRPYRNGNQSVGIKPSQTTGSTPKQFTYVNKSVPSIFPKAAGVFNGAAGDTFLNFQTGAISGADTTSSSFTPQIPTTGNSIIAVISLTTSDLLSVSFGTIGTYAQCATAIQNQSTGGAGGIPSISAVMPIAFVILTSQDGVNINDLDVIDARSNFAFGGAPGATSWPNLFVATEADLTSALASAVTAGGAVICLLNSFTMSSAHTVPAGTIIQGRGGQSIITVTGSGALTFADGASMRDVWFTTALTSGSLINLSNNYAVIRNCQFTIPTNSTGEAILVTGNSNKMYNNIFIGVQGADTGYGIVYQSGVDNADSESVFLP